MNKVKNPIDNYEAAHSALIEDHPYEPAREDQPWGRCKHCKLAQAEHMHTNHPYTFNAQMAFPPTNLPPGARLVEKGEPGPEEELPISTAPEIPLVQAREYMIKKEPLDTNCWRCGKLPGRRIPENGAYLCPGCEAILKP